MATVAAPPLTELLRVEGRSLAGHAADGGGSVADIHPQHHWEGPRGGGGSLPLSLSLLLPLLLPQFIQLLEENGLQEEVE